MIRLLNARPAGGLGFMAVGGDAFELAPGESREISYEHADKLLASPGVPEFIACGWLVVEQFKADAKAASLKIDPMAEAAPSPVEPLPVVEDAPASPPHGRRRRGG
jgi:hypothetical protein